MRGRTLAQLEAEIEFLESYALTCLERAERRKAQVRALRAAARERAEEARDLRAVMRVAQEFGGGRVIGPASVQHGSMRT